MTSISISSRMERAITPSTRRGGVGAQQTRFSAWPRPLRIMPQCNVQCTAEAVSHMNPKVVCIGEALFGAPCSLVIVDMLANEKGKEKKDVSSWTGYPGGAPCNVACGLGKLNIPVAFVTCLGQDERGDELAELISRRGVDMGAVRRVPEPTRDVYVVRKLDGDRVFDSFGQDTNTFSDCFIRVEDLPREMIGGAQVVVMGTLGLAYPQTGAAMREAMAICKNTDTVVLVDVNWRPVFWNDPEAAKADILPFTLEADIVKITDDEAEWLFDIDRKSALKNPSLVLEKLPKARGVLVTAGGDGCSYCMRTHGKLENSGVVPVYSVDVQDTTGAGDAFTCGFLAYLLAEPHEKPLLELLECPEEALEAVRFAAATGALTTQRGGAIDAQPTLQEIENLVAQAHAAEDA